MYRTYTFHVVKIYILQNLKKKSCCFTCCDKGIPFLFEQDNKIQPNRYQINVKDKRLIRIILTIQRCVLQIVIVDVKRSTRHSWSRHKPRGVSAKSSPE